VHRLAGRRADGRDRVRDLAALAVAERAGEDALGRIARDADIALMFAVWVATAGS
jgi:hypothetical protein